MFYVWEVRRAGLVYCTFQKYIFAQRQRTCDVVKVIGGKSEAATRRIK